MSDTELEKGLDLSYSDQIHSSAQRSTWKSVAMVLVCTTAMMLNTSSSTAVSITLPTIGRELGVSEDQLQWLVSGFSLSSGCLFILFGRLADLYGRKKAFLLGVAWLGLCSIGCGFASNFAVLCILRGLAGFGPAAATPASLGILAHAFPPSRARSMAFAVFSAGGAIGGAMGTQLGAVLTQYTPSTWRAPFYLLAALSILCYIGAYLVIDTDVPSTEEDKRVDWTGAAFITAGLVLITFALGRAELAQQGWKTPYIIVLLTLGVLLVASFLLWQHYLEKNVGGLCPPLARLSLWSRANGKFAVVLIVAFMESAAFHSWTFWCLLFNQDYRGLSPVLTAVRTLPSPVAGIICNMLLGLVLGNVDVVFITVFGTFCTGTACMLFAVIDPALPYWAMGFPAAALSIIGAVCVFSTGTLFIAKASQPHEQSLAGGLLQTLIQLGSAFGLAITTIVHNCTLRIDSEGMGVVMLPSEDNVPHVAQLKAYHAAQWAAFAFAAIGAILAVIFLRGVGPLGNKNAEPLGSLSDTKGAAGDSISEKIEVTAPSKEGSREAK